MERRFGIRMRNGHEMYQYYESDQATCGHGISWNFAIILGFVFLASDAYVWGFGTVFSLVHHRHCLWRRDARPRGRLRCGLASSTLFVSIFSPGRKGCRRGSPFVSEHYETRIK